MRLQLLFPEPEIVITCRTANAVARACKPRPVSIASACLHGCPRTACERAEIHRSAAAKHPDAYGLHQNSAAQMALRSGRFRAMSRVERLESAMGCLRTSSPPKALVKRTCWYPRDPVCASRRTGRSKSSFTTHKLSHTDQKVHFCHLLQDLIWSVGFPSVSRPYRRLPSKFSAITPGHIEGAACLPDVAPESCIDREQNNHL